MRIRLICVFLQVEPVQIICAKLFAGCTLIVNIISRVAVSQERQEICKSSFTQLSSCGQREQKNGDHTKYW